MKGSSHKTYFIIFLLFAVIQPVWVVGQQNFDSSGIRFYEKKEMNWGFLFRADKEREELNTDNSKQYEEISLGKIKFRFRNRYWTFLDYKQEQLEFNFELGPMCGSGNWIDNTYISNRTADHSITGLRTNGLISYASRFYYDDKNYTLVQIDAHARYDLFRKHSKGVSIDSNGVSTDFDTKANGTKFRYGFSARAGWGIGRLNPMNHVMIADYIFDKNYGKRTFSNEEINKVVKKIEDIKNNRDFLTGHDNEKESEQLTNFLNQQMFLIRPENLEQEWKYGEFLPRFNGSRVELGPFFRYYSREPDFVYGGYIQYNKEKYCNYKWNRKFNAGVNYNWYKRDDWMLAEIELGWSYYIKLRSQFDFGVKYVPGIIMNDFTDPGKLNNGVIPYIGYFTQVNGKARVDMTFAWRITDDKKLMLPGPEFSLSIYRSSY